ncbi:MAG: adenylate/guanylate cyclase domain-containing protein [Proteobacteria bacterium]|nr:adenylate/guanylate cyclase domain-containing protein [Pseudomonadota bacterium]
MLRSLFKSIGRSSGRWHIVMALLFALALAAELFGLHALQNTEARLGDVYQRRHAAEQQPDPDIVVIDIDDRSMVAMQEIAGLWAWRREIHADLLEILSQFAPRAVVFDLAFTEHDMRQPKSDARLSEVVQALPYVYLPATRLPAELDGKGVRLASLTTALHLTGNASDPATVAIQLPEAIAPAGWRLGLINADKDDDGRLRRNRLYTEVHGWKLPSMPARVVSDLGMALPPGDDFLLRWSSKLHQHLPYGDLYKLLTERQPLHADDVKQMENLFRNKIIVIGSSATSAFDHHLSPLGSGTPGVDILATAIDNLKNGNNVRTVSPLLPFLFGLALIALLAWAFTHRMNPMLIGIGLALLTMASLALADAALAGNRLLPVVTPLAFAWAWYLTAAVGGYLRERRSREQAVSLFGRFLNPNVVRQIVEHGQTVESMSGKTSEVTVLFSDIRGFTTLSESRQPHEIVTLLNRYFDRQVEVVFRHGGTLDKFIGDCIMAFWGAPVEDARHADNAVAAALEMQQVLLDFKKELEAEQGNTLDFDVGIGVHSGPAVVGFIGAQKKLDYTAIGDTVNLASRVEGLTKGIARVLVTRETMQLCQSSDDMRFEAKGSFAVKGRVAEVELFEPIRKAT